MPHSIISFRLYFDDDFLLDYEITGVLQRCMAHPRGCRPQPSVVHKFMEFINYHGVQRPSCRVIHPSTHISNRHRTDTGNPTSPLSESKVESVPLSAEKPPRAGGEQPFRPRRRRRRVKTADCTERKVHVFKVRCRVSFRRRSVG